MAISRSPPQCKGPAVLAVVLLLAASPSWSFGAGAAGAPTPLSGPTELIGGVFWSQDLRVTNDSAEDFSPVLTVDANLTGDLLWRRNVSGEDVIHYGRLDRQGNVSHGPIAITNRTWRMDNGKVPVGPNAGVDSADHIHVAYQVGNNITYTQYFDNGSVRVPQRVVGPADSALSRYPTLAVAPDDTVHIAHGEYRFWCEDVAYDKLDANGGDVWIDRIVSSDLGVRVNRSNLRVDPFVPNFHFVVGSDAGTYYGRFNRFGVKVLPSVLIRNATDGLVTDVAGSADGSAHLVWQDAGQLYYTRVNSTGSKVVDALRLPANGTASGVPHITFSNRSAVNIVWQDNRTGTSQVFWLQFFAGQERSTLTPFQLSNSSAGAFEPWVASGPDGGVRVAWADLRDGNLEIYHKYQSVCSLAFDPLPGLLGPGAFFFMLPNETRVINLTLRNLGLGPEDVNLTAQPLFPSNSSGWIFAFNQTGQAGVEGGSSLDVALTVFAPPDAPNSDTTLLMVNATARGGTCLAFTWTQPIVRYVRSFFFTPDALSRTGLPGQDVVFSVELQNTGDLFEPNIILGAQIDAAHSGWGLAYPLVGPSLAPGESTTFDFTVSLPANGTQVNAGDIALVNLTAGSSVEPAWESTGGLAITVGTVMDIAVSATLTNVTVVPGLNVTSRVTISRSGNVPGAALTNLSLEWIGGNPWDAALSRTAVALTLNTPQTANLVVSVPPQALAGESTTVRVHAVNQSSGTSGQVEVTVVAGRVCGLSLSAGAEGQTLPGEHVRLGVTAANAGNAPESITVRATGLPAGWAAVFLESGSSTLTVDLAVGESRPVAFEVVPASDAVAGVYDFGAQATGAACGGASAPLHVTVMQAGGGSLTAAVAEATLLPGAEASFELTVTSTVNAPTQWNLSAGTLPAGVGPARFQVTHVNGSPVSLPEQAFVDLPAFGSAVVTLWIPVAADIDRSLIGLEATAAFEGGDPVRSTLVIRVNRPDLSVVAVDYGPEPLRAGTVIPVNVTVSNGGSGPSGSFEVRFFLDGQVADAATVEGLAPGTETVVTFTWLPPEGHFDLRVVVARLTGPTDEQASNDRYQRYVLVLPPVPPEGGDPAPQPGFIPGPGAALVLAAAAMGAALALMRRRR